MATKWVYFFDEIEEIRKSIGGDFDDVRALLGGKGANLAEMTRIGIPVPHGITITTQACNAYLENDKTYPEDMWNQVVAAMKIIEDRTGKQFGGSKNPLLVSCRSGAKQSMPGMMDTVLNIGLNDKTANGLIKMTNNPCFVYDAYRRLIQMFGSVVMGMPDEMFEDTITEIRRDAGAKSDSDLKADHWKAVTEKFKWIFMRQAGHDFPEDPYEQLNLATEAVFASWNGKRAIDYRNAAGIPHDLGTAVTIMTMVFGNLGDDSATGVAMTRSGSTGEKFLEGDYLVNAQGEDVVAGIRMTNDISELKKEMPKAYQELERIAQVLETHYREMQDIEFTIEKNKLWMLQTRNGKRTAQAAVRIAADMVDEGLISQEEAVMRVTPEQVDFFLHPQFGRETLHIAREAGNLLAAGINASPGAAYGVVAMDADLAESWAKEGKEVVMVRAETKPDDVHGMLASRGILTSRGGRTSHAALVARQFGKPAVVGVAALEIDLNSRIIKVDGKVVKEGEWISIDGTSGEVFLGKLPTKVPDIKDPWLKRLLVWADGIRKLKIRANSDYPEDAKRALEYGAEGIGLCRSEHMFFETNRLPHVHKLIMTDLPIERNEALEILLPFQRNDFAELFRVMEGLPVIIRLLDPPLHEFLPNHTSLLRELTDLKIRLQHADTLSEIDEYLDKIREKESVLKRVENLQESNPMLGLRGVRLGIHLPEITVMQVRAIFEAACLVRKEGIHVKPEIMIPLTAHENELKIQRKVLENEAKKVLKEQNLDLDYKFGTMIEIPRAALTADDIAQHASFFSFGTNDLTQTTYGISRDDAEAGFLIEYMEKGIITEDPFAIIDQKGVGALMKIAVEKGKSRNPDLEIGICGEHGGEANSIMFCHQLGLDYVSCSPFRVPVARLAAAHAELLYPMRTE
ncbi:pyruvate, phosphate dikinase [bacterium]|nr:pyruvate, phosphate dikinase [bacterium]